MIWRWTETNTSSCCSGKNGNGHKRSSRETSVFYPQKILTTTNLVARDLELMLWVLMDFYEIHILPSSKLVGTDSGFLAETTAGRSGCGHLNHPANLQDCLKKQ